MSIYNLPGALPALLPRAPQERQASSSQQATRSASADTAARASLWYSLLQAAEQETSAPGGAHTAKGAGDAFERLWTATSRDVIEKIRKQQAFIQPADIEDIIVSNFPVRDHRLASLMLDAMTRFASMKSLNGLQARLVHYSRDKKRDICYGQEGSLGSTLHYLAQKHKYSTVNRKYNAGLPSPFRIDVLKQKSLDKVEKGAILLDAVTLHQLAQSRALRDHVLKHNLKLLYPQGWEEGVNPFNQLSMEGIAVKLAQLVNIAKQLQQTQGLSEEQSVEKALSHPTRSLLASWGLERQLKILEPGFPSVQPLDTVVTQEGGFPSSDKIAEQLAPASISEKSLDSALEKFPERAYKQGALAVLAQQAEIFSPLRLSLTAQDLHLKILDYARAHKIPANRIFYYIPTKGKSFGLVSGNHLMVNEVPFTQLIQNPASIKNPAESILVILDDVAGTGFSLYTTKNLIRQSGFSGKVIIAPMVSTSEAKTRLEGGEDPNMAYLAAYPVETFKSHPSFQALSPALKKIMQRAVGSLGFKENGLSVAFPHMAPDNNNGFFAMHIAPYFTLNRAGSKGAGFHYPSEKLDELMETIHGDSRNRPKVDSDLALGASDFEWDDSDFESAVSDLEEDSDNSPVVHLSLGGLKKSPAQMNLAELAKEGALARMDTDLSAQWKTPSAFHKVPLSSSI